MSYNLSQSKQETIKFLCDEFRKYNHINVDECEKYGVKRGLRNPDGTGVLAGLTAICDVEGYNMVDGVKAVSYTHLAIQLVLSGAVYL